MYFIPQFDIALSTRVTSNEVTIPASVIGTKALTLSPTGYASTMTSIQVIKNDVVVTAPYTVVAGDRIRVSGITSAVNETPTYIGILIADVGYLVFGANTRSAASTDTVPLAKYTNPLAPIASPYVPNTPNNRILILTPATNAVAAFTLEPTVAGPGPQDGNAYVFAPDTLRGVVQRVDTSGTVVHSMNVNSPLNVSYTPTYSPEPDTTTRTLITSPLTGVVSIFNGQTHQFEYSFEVDSPYAVAGIGTNVAEEFFFWVVSRNINRVSLYKYYDGMVTREFYFDLNAGCLPTNLVVDGANNAYVVCPGTDQVVKVFADGVTPPVYLNLTANSRPTNIVINEFKTHAYVMCSNAATTAVITLTTNAIAVLNTQKYLSCGAIANGRLYVGSIYSPVFGYYPLTSDTTFGSYVSLSTAYKLIEGMTLNTDRSQIYVLVQHEDAPSLIAPIDKAPDGLQAVYSHVSADLVPNTVVTYQNLAISGLDATSTFRVPSMASAQMWRNGANNFNSAAINNGDTLQVRVTVPANGLPVSIPLMYTGGAILFVIDETPAVIADPIRVAGWMRGG